MDEKSDKGLTSLEKAFRKACKRIKEIRLPEEVARRVREIETWEAESSRSEKRFGEQANYGLPLQLSYQF